MKTARFWKAMIPISLIVALVMLWLIWPWMTYRHAIQKFNGSTSGSVWSFTMNTFSDRISSAQVVKFYFEGSARLIELDPSSESYTYQDLEGYDGCITISQHETCYDFVRLFGANDNDSITVGRASGSFPKKRHLNPQIPTNQLPSGIIRPW